MFARKSKWRQRAGNFHKTTKILPGLVRKAGRASAGPSRIFGKLSASQFRSSKPFHTSFSIFPMNAANWVALVLTWLTSPHRGWLDLQQARTDSPRILHLTFFYNDLPSCCRPVTPHLTASKLRQAPLLLLSLCLPEFLLLYPTAQFMP